MKVFKNVLITGSGSGLGKSAAITLASRGHTVYATTQYQIQADDLNDFAKIHNLPLKAFKLDILLEQDRNLVKNYDIDVLINNAAIGDSGSVAEVRVDRFENVFETNVFSNIKITQIALKNMIENKKEGRIIFLSSLAGRISMPFLAPYCASKFAIEGFASALRYEMKLLDYANIQIGIIEPGAYHTGFNQINNDKKWIWMKQNSYFKDKLNYLEKNEEKLWNFIECNNFNSIIQKYVKAVESKKVKFRYSSPISQAVLVQLGRILGM